MVIAATVVGLGLALPGPATASGAGGPASGTISGTVPLRGMNVQLMAAMSGDRLPQRLGGARSGAGGAFTLRYTGKRANQVTYLLATRPGGAAEAGYPIYGQ